MQTKKMSLVESLVNVAIGLAFANLVQWLVFIVYYGLPIPLWENAIISVVFTVVSICRSYCLRRVFNWLSKQGELYVA